MPAVKGAVNASRVTLFSMAPLIVLSSTSVRFIACSITIAEKFNGATQEVLEDIGPEIADVGKIVHRRPAGIHADRMAIARDDLLFTARLSIKNFKCMFLHF